MVRTLSLLLLVLGGLLTGHGPAASQARADSTAIRQAALDYIEGWYAGDGDRMARSLHPELVKRIVRPEPDGRSRLEAMSAEQLVAATRGQRGNGGSGRKDVRILDVFDGSASVRVDADEWIDYMHLARWNGEWRMLSGTNSTRPLGW
jgi:hypothetical protein